MKIGKFKSTTAPANNHAPEYFCNPDNIFTKQYIYKQFISVFLV